MRKSIRKIIAIPPILGASAAIGFLSFVGILVLPSYLATIPIACVSFFLASIIEGEIYRQNILNGLKKLSPFYIVRKFIQSKLIECCEDEENRKKSAFIMAYYDQRQCYYQLTLKKKKGMLTPDEKNQMASLKQRLLKQETEFYDFVRGAPWVSSEVAASLGCISELMRNEWNTKAQRKMIYQILSAVFSIGSGVAFGLATAAAIQVGLVQLATLETFMWLAAVPAGAIVWPLALLAALGWALMIYNTLVELIHDATLQKKFTEIKNFLFEKKKSLYALKQRFSHKKNWKSVITKWGMGFLIVLTIGIGLFSNFASFGTFLDKSISGMGLMGGISVFCEVLCYILTTLLLIAMTLFGIKNTLETLHGFLLSSDSHKETSTPGFFDRIKEHLPKRENIFQLINPFRALKKVISFPFIFVVFIGHIASIGATTDDPGFGIPQWLAAILCSLDEGSTDLHYFQHKDEKLPPSNWLEALHEHRHGGHIHSSLPTQFLNLLMIPLSILSAVWAYVASRVNDGYVYEKLSFFDQLKTQLGWGQKIIPPVSEETNSLLRPTVVRKEALKPSPFLSSVSPDNGFPGLRHRFAPLPGLYSP